MQPARFKHADFLLVEINKVHESSREFGGGAWAPFPNSAWQLSLAFAHFGEHEKSHLT